MNKLYILGAGAIGVSIAYKLSKKTSVTLITKTHSDQPFYFSSNNKKQCLTLNSTTVKQLNTSKSTIDTCIICVKSYQVMGAFKSIQKSLSPDANIFLCHNGINDLTPLLSLLGSSQGLFFISTAMAAVVIKPRYIKFTGEGQSFLGPCNKVARKRLEHLYQELFAHAMSPCFVENNIDELRWRKLLVNIAINPLTAIEQVRNGVLRSPKYAGPILNLLNEACHVAHLNGLDIPLHQALDQAYEVMQQTQLNTSSMAKDIEQNRTTEIDAICGFIIEQGAQHNYATPCNKKLFDAVKALENNSVS